MNVVTHIGLLEFQCTGARLTAVVSSNRFNDSVTIASNAIPPSPHGRHPTVDRSSARDVIVAVDDMTNRTIS